MVYFQEKNLFQSCWVISCYYDIYIYVCITSIFTFSICCYIFIFLGKSNHFLSHIGSLQVAALFCRSLKRSAYFITIPEDTFSEAWLTIVGCVTINYYRGFDWQFSYLIFHLSPYMVHEYGHMINLSHFKARPLRDLNPCPHASTTYLSHTYSNKSMRCFWWVLEICFKLFGFQLRILSPDEHITHGSCE